MKAFVLSAMAAALWSANAVAAEVKVLSAGAVEPGLHKAVEAFKQASGHTVTIQFNTAPQIARRLQEGTVADVLIAPPAGLAEQVKNGKIVAEGHAMLGSVVAGVTMRKDAASPSIGTTDAFKAA